MTGQPGTQGSGTPDAIACEEAFARIYEYLDGELCANWTDKVRHHIAVCRACYPHFDFERVFLDHIRSLGLPLESNDRLEARVRAALRSA